VITVVSDDRGEKSTAILFAVPCRKEKTDYGGARGVRRVPDEIREINIIGKQYQIVLKKIQTGIFTRAGNGEETENRTTVSAAATKYEF